MKIRQYQRMAIITNGLDTVRWIEKAQELLELRNKVGGALI